MKTRADIEAMSEDERQIKTAALRGWTDCGKIEGRHGRLFGKSPVQKVPLLLPDYLNSHDAMHSALQVMDKRQREQFVVCLEESDPAWCFHPKAYIGYIEHPADSIFDTFINRSAKDLNAAFLMVMMK